MWHVILYSSCSYIPWIIPGDNKSDLRCNIHVVNGLLINITYLKCLGGRSVKVNLCLSVTMDTEYRIYDMKENTTVINSEIQESRMPTGNRLFSFQAAHCQCV